MLPPWPLALVLIATVFAYAWAMNSPLYADDYIYLDAARQLSFGGYAREAFTPWGHEPLLPLTRDYWRPLAFLWFETAEPVFGGSPLPYHLVNLGVHLGSVVLVWRLACRLDARPVVRAVAAIVFALYPGSFEAVTWISSINSAGLTLALGGWLVFLASTKDGAVTRRAAWLSAGLVAAGLMFRESAISLLPAMGLWYLLMQQRDGLREPRTYLPFLPFVVVGIAYVLIRTRLFSEPFANPDVYAFDRDAPERWWYYVQNALLPFRDPVLGWRDSAQDMAGVALLATPVVAMWRRRWDVVALSVGLLVALVPNAATLLGVGQRYFYFPSPVLALLLGVVVADGTRGLKHRQVIALGPQGAAMAGCAGLLALAGAANAVIYDRIDNWDRSGPRQQQDWVEGLQAAYPALPVGGTLYCSNLPFILALYGAAILEPTVRWYYPEIGRAVHYLPESPPLLGPNDRWYEGNAPVTER